MRSQVLHHPHFVQHHNLGHESDRLEPQREAPRELPRREAGVEHACQQECHGDEDFPVGELVAEGVVGCAEGQLVSHQVDDGRRRGNEEYLHASVVHAHEIHEEVHVAHAEHQQVHFLRLARDAYQAVLEVRPKERFFKN